MEKLEQAFKLFDDYNKQSPDQLTWKGITYPSEYFYSVELYNWVKKLSPEASEGLLLASRSQHIGRWEVPRNIYPDGRIGYLTWRSDLKKIHAQKAASILQTVGYSDEIIARVQVIIQKLQLKLDPEVQIIENALCLVFLEFQFDDLVEKLPEEKMITVLRKTWKKMSKEGHDAAMTLNFSPEGHALITKALQDN
ncbi:DUF4202 domain-containing protein [Arcticibacter eurypsychrophilus]|uniref:DUF4202 domain-containing protein n=1 Tax=Arcticibacter eurypsychrophilus TaxID=1434752 RepID=UPI00084D11C2|nr:DUF4202 domain-containing protein [Arcticibacter eurypsychrophilus]